MNVQVNVEQLKAALRQIKNPKVSQELAELALELLPKNLLDDTIQTYYFQYVKKTPYFIAQHMTYPLKKYYFHDDKELIDFLNENSVHATKVNIKILETALLHKIPLEGYNITYVNR